MKQLRTHVRDWMSRHPVTVSPGTSLINAYQLMQSRSVRRLPVVDDRGHLLGIITQSDLQRMAPFAANEPEQTAAIFELAGMTVEEIMAPTPITVAPEHAIWEAATRMLRHKVSGLPVVEQGQVVGIITESDIFELVVEAWTKAADVVPTSS
jgi:acetoin utilization protein AcuB